MSKLATIAFGAAIAIAPALIHAQTDMGQTGNTSNTGNAAGVNNNQAPGANTQGNDLGANAGNYNPNANPNNVNNNANTGTPGSNAGIGQSNRAMPHTANPWLSLLLCGTTLSGAGVAMRRLRRA